MKSVQLVMCDSDFPVRGYSVCVGKRDKLYVGECIIDLRGYLVCMTFGSPYSLSEREFVDFNVDLILLECYFFPPRSRCSMQLY